MEKYKKLKYVSYTIAFQEVPNEVSLVINISGCTHKCKDCHSKYLWEYNGNYISEDLDSILSIYPGMITCICFMGGEQNIKELNMLLNRIKKIYGYKTCVYSGCDNYGMFDLSVLDYLKIGEYNSELGGLDSNNTNQKFFSVSNNNLKDITYVFRKDKLELNEN